MDPLPANLEVAITPKPVSINGTTDVLLNDLNALRHEVQGRDGEHKTEPIQRIGIAD
jgi:hypothetical protein